MVIRMEDVGLKLPVYGTSLSFRNWITSRTREQKGPMVVNALDSVSFNVEEGDRIGLIGHNGAGKSTLLRMLGGIYKPTSGKLEIFGETKCLFSLTSGMEEEASGIENIEIKARLLGIQKTRVAEVVRDVVEFSELGESLERPIRTYSNGMKLRLAFGVMTATTSEILLLDEVIGVGDANFIQKAQKRLLNLVDQTRAMIIASHNPMVLRLICNRIIKFENGRILSDERVTQDSSISEFSPIT